MEERDEEDELDSSLDRKNSSTLKATTDAVADPSTAAGADPSVTQFGREPDHLSPENT